MSFAADYQFGLEKQNELLTVLSKAFDVELTEDKNKYSEIDYRSSTLNVELKSRTCAYGDFKTTLLPKSKVEYVRKYCQGKKNVFAFAFTDGIYYIEYDEMLFGGFECKSFVRNQRSDYSDRPTLYYYIPVAQLKKI